MIPPVDQPKGELSEARVRERLIQFAKALNSGDWTGALLVAYNPSGSVGISYEIAKAALIADINALATKQAGPQATTVGRHDSKETLARVVAILTEFGMPPEGEVDQFEWLRERLALIGIPSAEAEAPPPELLERMQQAGFRKDRFPTCQHIIWHGGPGYTVCGSCGARPEDLAELTRLYVASPAVTEREQALTDVAAERERQKSVEGWTPEHDDEHANGELGLAAACYAAPVPIRCEWPVPDGARSAGEGSAAFPPTQWLSAWPWDDKWWKPTNRRRDLVKAGALILAEIERLDRAALKDTKP